MRCLVDIDKMKEKAGRYGKPLVLMAKAQCYGLGIEVAASLEPLLWGYGVAYAEEGAQLRALTDKPILVTTPACDPRLVVRYGLTPVVSTVAEVRALAAVDEAVGVHIKLNTGMNRFGVRGRNALEGLLNAVDEAPLLTVQGVMTHYADTQSYARQNRVMAPWLSYIYAREGRVPFHSEATSTAFHARGDLVRLGMGIYRDSVTLYSRIAALQHLRRGECAGYEGVYRAPDDCIVAIVYGGYADGIGRDLVGYRVRCGGGLHPIVAVCMDVCLVALTTPCAVGDEVCLLGADLVEPKCGLYEMYTRIGPRFTKEYIRGRPSKGELCGS